MLYDPDRRPEVSSLVLLAALCLGRDPREVAAGIGGAAALKATTGMIAPHITRREAAEDRRDPAEGPAEGSPPQELAWENLTGPQALPAGDPEMIGEMRYLSPLASSPDGPG